MLHDARMPTLISWHWYCPICETENWQWDERPPAGCIQCGTELRVVLDTYDRPR